MCGVETRVGLAAAGLRELKAGLGEDDCGTNRGEDGCWIHDREGVGKGGRCGRQRLYVCMSRECAGYKNEVEA